MGILYCFIGLMLLIGLAVLAQPLLKNSSLRKTYFVIAVLISIASISFYQFSGNKLALRTWLTQGKQHYLLQEKLIQLGGVDAIIAKIQQRLATNPNDARGWFILGKLYLSAQQLDAAKQALQKAHDLAPLDFPPPSQLQTALPR